jgi:hypothetical protein
METAVSKNVIGDDLFVAWDDDGVCPMLTDQLVLDADGDVHEGEGVQLGQHHVEPLHHLLAIINKNQCSVSMTF